MTFVADMKVHGSINPGLQGYEAARESEPGGQGPDMCQPQPTGLPAGLAPLGFPVLCHR